MLKQMSLRAVLAAGLMGGVAVGASHAEELKAEDFAKAPAVARVTMSAEGDFLAGIVANPNDPEAPALASWDLSSIDPSKPLLPSHITPSDGRMTFQVGNALKAGKVIAVANQPGTFNLNGCGEGRTTGATKTWAYKTFLTDSDVADLDDLNARGNVVGVSDLTLRCLELGAPPSFIDLPLDPENIIVARVETDDFQTRFSKVNLRTGRSTALYRDNTVESIDFIDPRDGKVRTKQSTNALGGGKYTFDVLVLDEASGRFEVEEPLRTNTETRNTVSVIGFDEATGKYFVATDKFSDKVAIYLYDARTDKFDDEVLFAHPDFDAAGVILGRHESDFGEILGFSYNGAELTDYWTDPGMRSIQQGLEQAFEGQMVNLREWTGDRSKILFSTESPQHPPSYFLLLDQSKVVGIGNERPWINPEDMGERELVYYTARDGMKIPAFLTLPPGFKKGDPAPPAIVHPHGGPWARDSLGWDQSGWTQFLATRGYAVLQPQYRGSQGWGHSLWVAGDKEWGQKMQDDKDDGAQWMIDQGYAAEGRIAIFGYSYGGFAAFAAAVRPDGPFKCAIAGAGVANLTRIGNNWSENRLQRAYQGVTVTGMDPSRNMDKFHMPILIYHGEHDVRVPLFHATDFYNDVKSTGKAELLVLKDMGHQLDKWTPDNHRDSLGAIESFLKNDCKL